MNEIIATLEQRRAEAAARNAEASANLERIRRIDAEVQALLRSAEKHEREARREYMDADVALSIAEGGAA